ncbi:MAG TPA: hypothetical protein VGC58_01960 [Candidatus Paceibacterota bacterium]
MEEEPELKDGTRWLMRGTAIFFDLISCVPGFNEVTLIFGNMTFFLWGTMHGINFIKPKNLKRFIPEIIVEIIPVVSIIPAFSIAVFLMTSKNKTIKTMAQNTPTKNNVLKFPNRNLKEVRELDKAA